MKRFFLLPILGLLTGCFSGSLMRPYSRSCESAVFAGVVDPSCDKVDVNSKEIINPLSLSPVVSVNGKKETNKIGDVEAESIYVKTKATSNYDTYAVTTETKQRASTLEESILRGTRGLKNVAVNNIAIEVEHSRWSTTEIYSDLSAIITGDAVKIEQQGAK